MLVNESGQIVWQYGKAGVTGSGFNQLNTPVQFTYLPNGDILITDQANERVIEVSRGHQIVWQYGTTGVTGSGANQLSNPNSAELLANGNILIARREQQPGHRGPTGITRSCGRTTQPTATAR